MVRIFQSIVFAFVCLAFLQPVAGWTQPAEPLYVIDHPTAGMLPNGSYQIAGRAGPESSFLMSFAVGFKDRLMVGASYGVHRVFEYGSPDVNNRLGLQVRVRLIEENRSPALALGFDSQGNGIYSATAGRYQRKSPGFYGVLSKNWGVPLGDLSLHGGLSFTMEREDDNDPNLFMGLDYLVFERFSFLLDADAAFNDNSEGGPYGQGGIYLDAGARLFIGEALFMTFVFRDLTQNATGSPGVGRGFELAWIGAF